MSGTANRLTAGIIVVLALAAIVAGATGLYAAWKPGALQAVPAQSGPAIESPIQMDTVFVSAERELSAEPIVMDTVFAYAERDQAVVAEPLDLN